MKKITEVIELYKTFQTLSIYGIALSQIATSNSDNTKEFLDGAPQPKPIVEREGRHHRGEEDSRLIISGSGGNSKQLEGSTINQLKFPSQLVMEEAYNRLNMQRNPNRQIVHQEDLKQKESHKHRGEVGLASKEVHDKTE